VQRGGEKRKAKLQVNCKWTNARGKCRERSEMNQNMGSRGGGGKADEGKRKITVKNGRRRKRSGTNS